MIGVVVKMGMDNFILFRLSWELFECRIDFDFFFFFGKIIIFVGNVEVFRYEYEFGCCVMGYDVFFVLDSIIVGCDFKGVIVVLLILFSDVMIFDLFFYWSYFIFILIGFNLIDGRLVFEIIDN